jgi:hypothetical protein
MLNANLHFHCTIIDGVFEAAVPGLASDLRVAPTAVPFSAQGEGVRFREATALGHKDIAAVQRAVRKRVLRLCEASSLVCLGKHPCCSDASCSSGAACSRPKAAARCAKWGHGARFSLQPRSASRPRRKGPSYWSAIHSAPSCRSRRLDRHRWTRVRAKDYHLCVPAQPSEHGPGRTETTTSRPSGGRPVATRPALPGNMRCETALNVLSFDEQQ